MMEVMIDERTCVDEAGIPHTFQYVLLQDKVVRDDFSGADYGVLVRSAAGEQAAVPHISPDRQRITGLLALLCEQGVSPLHLRDVIDDWL